MHDKNLTTRQTPTEQTSTNGALRDGQLRRGVLFRVLKAQPMIALAAKVVKQKQLATYSQLYWLSKRTSRRIPGVFRFPFGPVHYVDARSLADQYAEIFVNRQYEVAGLGHAPRIIDCGGNIGLSAL